MTEDEWLAGTDLDPMLLFASRRASGRKLRLFACACCRRILDRVEDHCAHDAVAVNERYADGKASIDELIAARRAVGQADVGRLPETRRWAMQAVWLAAGHPKVQVQGVAWDAARARRGAVLRAKEREAQCELLREMFGNPFRPLHVEAAWLRWNDRCVVRIARAVYEARNFTDLPILADALVEAGCTNEELLDHCRAQVEHSRGCWAIDFLLGLE